MDDKQNKLNDLLRELACNDSELNESSIRDYFWKFHDIYQGDFRHMYSSVFGTITEIDKADQYNIMQLADNINQLNDIFTEWKHSRQDCVTDGFCKKIGKLNDHINLDIARIEYTRQVADKIVTDNDERTKDTNRQLKRIGNQASKMQKEYVTILGIFSSIVITFVAGMVFSSSVLSNIDKASIYRLFFIMIMIALMLFNLLNMLLEFIRRINGGGISLAVSGQKNSLVSNVNVMLFLMLIIDIVCWCFYWYRSMHPYGFFSF